jgi:putative sigma-54 modulation protein
MRIDFTFRHCDNNPEVMEYVSSRIAKLEKFEMKPVRVHFTFTHEKAAQRVDLHVRGEDIEMHAHCECETFFTGIDEAIDKMARQMERKKSKVQRHKGSSSKVS